MNVLKSAATILVILFIASGCGSGSTDSSVECNQGDFINCYSGPDGTMNVGVCEAGIRQCTAQGTFGPCINEITPSIEDCDGLDNDCNDQIDDGITDVPTTCGDMECGSTGVLQCVNGGLVDTCEVCDASNGSTITITGPPTITDSSSSTTTDSVFFHIVVKNQNGVPLEDVQIWITYPWAIPSPASLVQLYDDDEPKDSPMSIITDSNGKFNLRMDYQRGGGLDYTGTIQVTSGSVVGTADFTVSSGSGS